MPLSRPALAILGISPRFARAHPPAVVIAVADAIYRTAQSQYHPDKGDEAIPLPSGVDLTELQEARDAVRRDPSACIKEVGRGEQTSREQKHAEELATRLSVLEELCDMLSQGATALWDSVAHGKLGLSIAEEMMDNVVAYSTLHLNGVAILVKDKEDFFEYLCHKGTWFKRPVVKSGFTKKNPCPPNIPAELILVSSAVGTEQGNFYDQAGPHEVVEGFEVIGSYRKSDLTKARARVQKKPGGQKPADDVPSALTLSIESSFNEGARNLDPLIASVLRPIVAAGSILQAVIRASDGSVRYLKGDIVAGVRIFDQKQRP